MAAVVGVRGASHLMFKLQIGVEWNFGGEACHISMVDSSGVSRYSRSASIEKLRLRSDGRMLVV
jgi:hypothetical protein